MIPMPELKDKTPVAQIPLEKNPNEGRFVTLLYDIPLDDNASLRVRTLGWQEPNSDDVTLEEDAPVRIVWLKVPVET